MVICFIAYIFHERCGVQNSSLCRVRRFKETVQGFALIKPLEFLYPEINLKAGEINLDILHRAMLVISLLVLANAYFKRPFI